MQQIKIEMEPQVLAWLIDIYRKKLHEKYCCEIFFNEIAHFFGQIILIKYEDMIYSLQFYVSALLLVGDQAMSNKNLKLLKVLKITLLNKIQVEKSINKKKKRR